MTDEQPGTQSVDPSAAARRPGPRQDAAAGGREEGSGAAPGGQEGLGFDRVLERLRQVVARLEQGNLSLEQSLLAFEEGVGLSRRGAEILDAAERRVEILIRGEDGAARAQPFGPGGAGAGTGDGDGRP